MKNNGYIFVTVGTSNFDSLIKIIDTYEFERIAITLGYEGVLIQNGNGKYIISHPRGTEPLINSDKWWVRHYNFKPSLKRDMERAGLVICHAGSGSILESLELQKNRKTVVVVNTSLMDNHQIELASKLNELGIIVLIPHPTSLLNILKNADLTLNIDLNLLHHHNFGDFLRDNCQLSANATQDKPIKVLIILGSGGHTTEMIKVLSHIDLSVYKPRIYCVAKTDKISVTKLKQFEENNYLEVKGDHFNVKMIPRSREVGQSYLTSIWTTIFALFASINVVYKIMPDLILCNGPGTCIPICFAVRLIRILTWNHKMKIVYFESLARVKRLSLSGRILYWCVDYFIVQWPNIYSFGTYLKNFFFAL